ncbi:hypothetical protein [Allokutzneria oryzae]|uniref:Uncharacterized protein n=1 Tax=Allokutzneria oryzae TaxID=1378989 RepID=A0ABV5ZTA0_9PSEU
MTPTTRTFGAAGAVVVTAAATLPVGLLFPLAVLGLLAVVVHGVVPQRSQDRVQWLQILLHHRQEMARLPRRGARSTGETTETTQGPISGTMPSRHPAGIPDNDPVHGHRRPAVGEKHVLREGRGA